MKTIAGVLVSVCTVTILFSNCSKDKTPVGLGGRIVIPDTTKVLIVSNDQNDNLWIVDTFPVHMTGFKFSSWSIEDSLPALVQLNQYDVVLFFENGTINPLYYTDTVGKRIYDYVMQGGHIVLGTFYWQDRSDGVDSLQGWTTTGWGPLETIDPIIANHGYAYGYDSTGTWISHPLTRGLDTIYCRYGGGYDSLRSGASAVAWWKNGEILMSYCNPSGRIVGLTLWPAEPSQNTAARYKYNGFYRAWENALLYAAWGDTRASTTTAATTAMVAAPRATAKSGTRGLEKQTPKKGGSRG
jgi:hypothetical protein